MATGKHWCGIDSHYNLVWKQRNRINARLYNIIRGVWTLWSHFVDLFLGSRQTYFIMWSWVNVFPSICLYAFLIQKVIIRKLFLFNKFNFVFTFMMTTKLTIIFQYISKWRKYKTLNVIFYKNQWLSTNIYTLKICCKMSSWVQQNFIHQNSLKTTNHNKWTNHFKLVILYIDSATKNAI